MNAWLGLALKSAWHRRMTLSLVVFSITLSSLLLLSIERVRVDVRSSFAQAVSGTDLVVGARTGAMQLMLYSVFHIGGASNNMRMDSVHAIQKDPAVAWTIPISLGDSHRGFPLLGTTPDYFKYFLFGDKQALKMEQGRAFTNSIDGLYESVIGAEVARKLNYRVGQNVIVSHGLSELHDEHEAEHEHEHGAEHDKGMGALEHKHDDKPFTVVGVLAATGTPVDRTVFVNLSAIEAIHLDWVAGAPIPGFKIEANLARKFDLAPKEITALLVGLKNRAAVFAVQRSIAGYTGEPLMAVLPGVALDELWQVLGIAENALIALSGMVALVSILGLIAVILAGLNERRRELSVLRAIGAGPRHILFLLTLEGVLMTLIGAALGGLLCLGLMTALAPWLNTTFGITVHNGAPRSDEWRLIGMIILAGFFASLAPALRAYFLSLNDGLSPR